MSKKNIACIGFLLPGEDTHEIDLKSKVSLLDYDIIIISPNIKEFYDYSYDEYLGKRCLNDANSFALKEHLEHWRREIMESMKAGKNVFLMLSSKDELYVATGTKSYSGTGRNRQTTRHVAPASNYQIIPTQIEITNSQGSSMSLSENAELLAPYWSEMAGISEYRVLLNGEGLKPIMVTKSGKKIVGAIYRHKNAEGSLFLLPYIDFDQDKYSYEKDNQYFWTDEASFLSKKFLSLLCALDKSAKSEGELSNAPDWVSLDQYSLPKEEQVMQELVKVESALEHLQKTKEDLEQQVISESALKRLLYEKGKPLEDAIRSALEIMGFKVTTYKDSDSEFDVVFECGEGRLIGEAEGKDNKAINIDKLRQLEMNLHEDFDRDEISEMAKGALIGNAYRLFHPNEREESFTQKCVSAANRNQTALIRTIDLFEVVQYLSGTEDPEYAATCRKAILDAVGIVEFPKKPMNEAAEVQAVAE